MREILVLADFELSSAVLKMRQNLVLADFVVYSALKRRRGGGYGMAAWNPYQALQTKKTFTTDKKS